MPSYSPSFFEAIADGSTRSAQAIVPLLINLLHPKSVVDVGCGWGRWLKAFQQQGITDVLGIDGAYVEAAHTELAPHQFLTHDLSRPFAVNRRFDLALSLEVAEHLAPESATSFVESLTNLAPVIAFSAAIPGQGGTNHLNEQWPEYWVQRFAAKGFLVIDAIRPLIWSHPDVEWWYAQNLLIFARPNEIVTRPALILGYIFEKYINQKQMGAYYTKEDVTDYIGKNTIVPRLFDMAKAGCAVGVRRLPCPPPHLLDDVGPQRGRSPHRAGISGTLDTASDCPLLTPPTSRLGRGRGQIAEPRAADADPHRNPPSHDGHRWQFGCTAGCTNRRHSAAFECTDVHFFHVFGLGKDESLKTLEMQGAGARKHRPASISIKLPGMDSNHDKEYQKLLCYRYTTG